MYAKSRAANRWGEWCALAVTIVALLVPLVAAAQQPATEEADEPTRDDKAGDAEDQEDRSDLSPPKLESFHEAPYPKEALEAEVEGVVVLILTIDRDGKVTRADVKKGPGHGLDEAAQKAARRFEFEPARRGDTPLKSRIRYPYRFKLPDEDGDDERLEAEDKTEDEPATGPSGESDTDDESGRDAGGDEVLEVSVQGESRGEQLERSARAVQVVDTEEASRESSDMGDVLAREEGVGVRRTGGLGSGTRFSLNGLDDEQIRFFLDGVPLELAGFPGGIANVPVNLIERVDVYSGVVPIHLGADALGGAVDLITADMPDENGGRASYQFGSFATHRATLGGQWVDEDSGLYLRGDGYFDYAENDYDIDVEVTDETGQLSDATVDRFHDGYEAAGGGVEVGFAERKWAERLSLRLFGSTFSRDLQHNVIMTVPYGEAKWQQDVAGATARYDHRPTESTHLQTALGYNHSRLNVDDTSECLYDWHGRCVREKNRPGELGGFPADRVIWEHAAFARLNGSYKPADEHTLRLSVAPTAVTRSGEERLERAGRDRDPYAAQRDLVDLVTGLEHQVDLVDDRLQNIAFVKDYLQRTMTDEELASGTRVERDRTSHHLGFGDSLRFRLNDWSYAKASYERAIRLPSSDEVFGNAIRIEPNLELRPERSHNANLGFVLDELESSAGIWRGKLNGFLRHSSDLIVLLGNNDSFSYQNVLAARALGAEVGAGWSSPEGTVGVDTNLTYSDLRNVGDEGAFADFEGDRVPNRPYLHANASARLSGDDFIVDDDRLSLVWRTRYVHDYYRGWESLGRTEFKQVIPTQWQHSAAVTHTLEGKVRSLSTTLEVQNLTDERLYDFFGVQRPGRAFYLKSTLDF